MTTEIKDTKTEPKRTCLAICCAGSVNSGKSSTIGVLTSGILDDGNGSARSLVAKHPHEIASGNTSDISTRTYELTTKNESLTFVDLCGHEDYFKTTTFGVSGHFPDYAFLIISANRGILPMTKQHLRLLMSLSVPILIIITHIDIVPEEIYKSTVEGIEKQIAFYYGKSTSVVFVNNLTDLKKTDDELNELKKTSTKTILDSLTNISDSKQTIFSCVSISNRTGFFIDVIRNIIELLPIRHFWLPGGEEAVMNNKIVKLFKNAIEKLNPGSLNLLPRYNDFKGGIFYIDACYNPPGTGLVITGIARGNSVKPGNTLYMGPFGKQFHEIRVRSLHNNTKQIVNTLNDHDRGCIAFAPLKKIDIKRNQITRGVICLDSLNLIKNVCFRFKAVIKLFSKSITIKVGYAPVIHLYTIRQSCRVCKIDPAENGGNEVICFDGETTSVAIVTFKFKMHPEFIEPYNLFVFRSGDIQGVGLITSIIPIDEDDDARPDPIKFKRNKRRKPPTIKQAAK